MQLNFNVMPEVLNRASRAFLDSPVKRLCHNYLEICHKGKNGLNSIPEFGELGSFEDAVRKIELSDDLTALQKNIVTLIEIYSYLHYCSS